MILTCCTFTGVDEKTSLDSLTKISNTFPFVEWGFLYSPNLQNSNKRYPSIDFIKTAFKTLPLNVNVALHVCGKGVRELIEENVNIFPLVQALSERNGRLQINFNAKHNPHYIDRFEGVFQRYQSTIQFITQFNEANVDVHNQITSPNHSILFDSSGGRGVTPDEWPLPFNGIRCGYAGGLGMDNVEQVLTDIDPNNTRRTHYWIDMESKIRDVDDNFDIEKCLIVAALCHTFIKIK